MVLTRRAPPHQVSSLQQFIRDTFQQQFIGCGLALNGLQFVYLNPLDIFLWGYIKGEGVCKPLTNIAGDFKPYYRCLEPACHLP
ncbi:hypothetical protein AVEN_209254-1 [Araneus ventricosus]|uniref:Uncharacterized protein n=1 Tax=Araneus ventricosus TaxID=182803 RepID=A0A4Y2USI4_ARAVE|nr:hypothetical protein AVEN_209254-1 [Araneus ventricosus]